MMEPTARSVAELKATGADPHRGDGEKNLSARAFYDARGGTCVEHRPVLAPGGDPARLNGSPVGLRYAWPDPARLL